MDKELENALKLFGVKMPMLGWKYSSSLSKKETIYKQKIENKKYCYNNGMFVIGIDSDVYSVVGIPGFEDVLIDNGFEKGEFYVPFSNGEIITDENIYKAFEFANENAKKFWKDYFISKSKEAARERMGRFISDEQMTIIEELTIPIDGKRLIDDSKIEFVVEEIDDFCKRDFSGTYNLTNDTYLLVMPDGSKRVGVLIDRLTDVIKKARFQISDITNPMANNEHFVDEKDKQKWKKLNNRYRFENGLSSHEWE